MRSPLVGLLVLFGLLSLGAPPSAAEGAAPPDGLSSATAAASCWEIKQSQPSAADGVYWLQTPLLVAPTQFHCDMTTDGGGWVLVGRGREGWRQEYQGLGTVAQVREQVEGPSAFAVRQLPSQTIDGLLNGGSVKDLADGIRLRRATAEDGSAWQEGRFTLPKRDRWVWTFGARHQISSYSLGAASSSQWSLTNTFGTDDDLARVDWRGRKEQGFALGWAYGSQRTASSAASAYVWSATNGGGYAIPFTQVFLRPRLLSADLRYAQIPDRGTDVTQITPLHSNTGLTSPWGVTGLASGVDGELHTEVTAMTQVGSRVYVGGNFEFAQRGADASGENKVAQAYLAAFDVNTGEFDRGFRPRLNGRVRSLVGLPDGTLVAGGFFTEANGAPASVIVGLDPATGATSPSWRANMVNRIIGGIPAVHAMALSPDHLYVAGSFTHITGGDVTSAIYARNMVRLRVSDGRPDPGWNPNLNGTALSIDYSPVGDRVYGGGYFTLSNGAPANKAAVFTTNAGASVGPWQFVPSTTKDGGYQMVVREVGNRFYVGGSQHSLFGYDRSTFERLSGNITLGGGDFQTSTHWNGVLYAGCHCDDWNYSNAFTFSNPGTAWTQVDKIGQLGAWNAATGAVLPEFNPVVKGRRGYGVWATLVDSQQRLWIGGDFVRANLTSGPSRWVGGFIRYPLRDSTAPSAPTGLVSNGIADGRLKLSWVAGADGQGQVAYEVMKDDRVVTTTAATTTSLPAPAADARYFVRSVDPAGNRSASTAVLRVAAGPADTAVALVPFGSVWSWRWDATALPVGWNQVQFDDSGWARGGGPIGYGSTSLGTNVASAGFPATRPLSLQARRSFDVVDAARVRDVQVRTYSDDGVIVFVNGVEVGRRDLPLGAISQNSYATRAPRTGVAVASPLVLDVPAGLLVSGRNVVAVQVNANYRSTPDLSFDLSMRVSTP